MEQELVQQFESDRMLPRYVYHKPFMVNFPDKCEWQNGFNPDNKVGLVWYTDGSKTNKRTGAGVYGWGFILGLHTTVLQTEMYTIEDNGEYRKALRV
jgi:hypothetical protein